MRRLYVTQKSVWSGPHKWAEGHTRPRYELCHPQTGSHYIDLPGGFILCSTDFASEWAEEEWHAHPEIARLPHPTMEGGVKLGDLLTPAWEHKQYRAHHREALAAIGIEDAHTVWDVHRIAKAIHPLVRLSHTY